MKLIRYLSAAAMMFVAVTANATIATDKLAAVCATDNPACNFYTLGGAERVWLVGGQHEKCDVAADKKTMDSLTNAVHGKSSIYVTKDKKPGAVALLEYLNKNKLQSCSLATRYSDISTRCGSATKGDQNICHAYVAGVLDMALVMDQVHQARVAGGKPVTMVPPFCQGGKPKLQMTDDEVMKTLGDWGRKHTADAAKIPAAGGIVDAMVETFPCPKAAAATTAKPTAPVKK